MATTADANQALEEKVMLQAGNHQGLIAHYKQQLASHPDAETRLRLAQTYQHTGDAESALFHLDLLPASWQEKPSVNLLRAKSLYSLSRFSDALLAINQSLKQDLNNGEAHNLKGLLHGETLQLDEARHAFLQARALMHDDISVLNNLAVLDIMTGDYQLATQRLWPLYQNGSRDESVVANLAFALANAQDAERFILMFPQHPPQYQRELYFALQQPRQ
ncbi:tetratricopeptide repeat protein [Grimontia sp. SpTr1]|uniref:tetratricopeptide repeat protein n=1 Tax=Grimontia sp. SpTr1 TaxID=2995319 RepID=UPI00248CCA13|nr:tetratricopeptide repeat protein [Grimontia sp. SpTr1]